MKELEDVKEAFRGLVLVSSPSLFLIHLQKKIEALEKAINSKSRAFHQTLRRFRLLRAGDRHVMSIIVMNESNYEV